MSNNSNFWPGRSAGGATPDRGSLDSETITLLRENHELLKAIKDNSTLIVVNLNAILRRLE